MTVSKKYPTDLCGPQFGGILNSRFDGRNQQAGHASAVILSWQSVTRNRGLRFIVWRWRSHIHMPPTCPAQASSLVCHLETLLLLSCNSAATLRWIGGARQGCERKALEDTQMVELNHFYCGFGELKLILLYAKANCFVLLFKEMYVNPWATAVSLQHPWVEKWQLMTLEKKRPSSFTEMDFYFT